MNKIGFSLIAFFFLLTFSGLKAQNCGTCSTSINSSDTSAIVLNTGETLCIDTMGYFTGSITLNGGTVCNKGFFKPTAFVFNSGVLNNFSNTSLDGNIGIGNNISIINSPGSIFSVNGSLTISGGTFTNDGITNIETNLVNTSGAVTNSSIINCTQVSGSNAITNTGIINSN